MKKTQKNRFSFINNFPLIIMVVSAILIVLLVNVYLSFKPYETIYQTGYMVLSSNMAYNLKNNNAISDNLNVGVASVRNGDSIYKQVDSYYVGEEQKKEIDYGYPIYSSDGLSLYTINDEFTLIDRNFDMLDGYPGLTLNFGYIYNDGDEEPADNLDYLFIKLKNSIFINSQIITIETNENVHSIPVNSPMYFHGKYINYYTFDGKKFNYNRMNDIEYESVVKIGDVEIAYADLLLKMDIVKKVDLEDSIEKEEEKDESNGDTNDGNGTGGSGSGTGGSGSGAGDGAGGSGSGTGDGAGGSGSGTGDGAGGSDLGTGEGSNNETEENPLDSIMGEYVEPTVTVENFVAKTYSVSTNIYINDPSGAITKSPTFEIYTSEGKLHSRKKITVTGQIKMVSLAADSKYKIVGKYTYKDRFGLELDKVFYEKEFNTQGVDGLEKIKITYETGSRYSNKIEIKDFTVLNPGIETLNGVKKITLRAWEKNNPDEVEETNISSNLLKKILKGTPTTICSLSTLKSDTVYKYEIIFYDRNNNILNLDGKNSGVVQTAKKTPTISSKYSYDYDNNSISVNITTNNKDNIYIDEYAYKFYKASGEIIDEGSLNYENGEQKKLLFENLVYETEYYLQITGTYDLEDGNGEVKLNKMIPSETPFYIPYPSNVSAWYNSSQLKKDDTSINTNVYISKKTNVLSKDNGFLKIYLEDTKGNPVKDAVGNDIIDTYINYDNLTEPNENSNYYQLITNPNSYFVEGLEYNDLISNTDYVLKISVGLLNPDMENGVEFESEKFIIGSPVKTQKETPTVKFTKKALWNDNLILDYVIYDKDNVIGDRPVRIDIYDKKCDEENLTEECKNLYLQNNVYGEQIKLTGQETVGHIEGSKYSLNDYTIAISTSSQNFSNSREYIKINEDNCSEGDCLKDFVTVSKEIDIMVQMHGQSYVDDTTESIFDIRLKKVCDENEQNNTCTGNVEDTNLAFYDCYNERNNWYCDESIKTFDHQENQTQVTVTNKKGTKYVNRRFYVVVEREGHKGPAINDKGDILFYIDYEINKNIKTIDHVSKTKDDLTSFFNIYDAKDAHYVVTEDLDFCGVTTNNTAFLTEFYGILDFQGHKVDLCYNADSSNKRFIKTLNSGSVLKNLEMNVHVDFNFVGKQIAGIIYENKGLIEDIIVNIEQDKDPKYTGEKYSVQYQGTVWHNHSPGIINRFVIYLKNDVNLHDGSSLGVYTNNGVLKNGYISTAPEELEKMKETQQSTTGYTVNTIDTFGMVSYQNYGEMKNIYSLINVSSSKNGISTILYSNDYGGIIKNTVSVAQTTISNGRGPNIYKNSAAANNNYYVDVNKYSGVYDFETYPYNIPMDESLLTNTFFMDSILNEENQFDISHSNYPMLKFSNFMQSKQKKIPIEYVMNKRFIGLSQATSAEDDLKLEITENQIKQENLSIEDVKNRYQTSKIKLYFNNPSSFIVEKINMEKGVVATIKSTEIDEATGMTVLNVDLTLTDGLAKSSYTITGYDYCYRNCNTPNKKIEHKVVDEKVSVDIFRQVTDYNSLLEAINNNENILITSKIKDNNGSIEIIDELKVKEDLIFSKANFSCNSLENLECLNSLPNNSEEFTYSGKIYGVVSEDKKTGKTIDFGGLIIERGYFINNFSGTLKNLQIRNLHIISQSQRIGFIGSLSSANIQNVDISDSTFEYSTPTRNQDSSIGTLAAKSLNLTFVDKVSSNNNTIRKVELGSTSPKYILNSHIGGLIGEISGTEIRNSYVYDINMDKINIDVILGRICIGGLVGYSVNGVISSVYTTGEILSNYSNIGGIVGKVEDSRVSNSYSYLNIFSTGKNIGGIIGSIEIYRKDSDYVNDVMFIGNIEGSDSIDYLIASSDSKKTLMNGYVLGNVPMNNVNNESQYTIGENQITFYTFDKNKRTFGPDYINKNDTEIRLPYLKNTSFAEQEIATLNYKKSGTTGITVTYPSDVLDCELGLCYSGGELAGVASSATITISNISENDRVEFSQLKLVSSKKNEDNSYSYELKPNGVYKNYYEIIINQERYRIKVPFYREVNCSGDDEKCVNGKRWEDISPNGEEENVYITEDFTLSNNNITNKKIINLYGNNCIISGTNDNTKKKIYQPLITSISGTMSNISFQNFEAEEKEVISVFGLILFNQGTITNSEFYNENETNMFENIKVNGLGSAGIIALNHGKVLDLNMESIEVVGIENVGGLIATNDGLTQNINANTIKVMGVKYIGGIQGRSEQGMENVSISNFRIESTSKTGVTNSNVGGIVGYGRCTNECSAKDGEIISIGSYIGGIHGRVLGSLVTNLEVINVDITNNKNTPKYVGGIAGYAWAIQNSYVDNLTLNFTNGTSIGGIAGSAAHTKNTYIKNSAIVGKENVGGIIGSRTTSTDDTLQSNVVSSSSISGKNNIGGIIGKAENGSNQSTSNNLVYKATIKFEKNVGGLIGYYENTDPDTQNTVIQNNLIFDLKIEPTISSPSNIGGIIGYLSQVPSSKSKLLKNSAYSLATDSLIPDNYNAVGYLLKKNTGVGGDGYAKNYSINTFNDELSSNTSKFKYYDGLVNLREIFPDKEITENGEQKEVQIDKFCYDKENKKVVNDGDNECVLSEEINKFELYASTISSPIAYIRRTTIENDINVQYEYFPVINSKSWKNSGVNIPRYDENIFVIEPEEFVCGGDKCPVDSEESAQVDVMSFSTRTLMTARRPSYSMQSTIKVPLSLDVYMVDVDKINIDFSDIDEEATFSYKIGDYRSSLIPVINRTYTISYDFKDNIEITLNSGGNLTTKTIKPKDLIRTISYVNDEVYYIKDGLLYNENKAITGNFINLYENKVLTNSGMIYNISTKEEYSANVDYKLQYEAKPLYSFEYGDGLIETYYNYSIYNSIIKNYQIILKNGLINVIDNSIDNKKDSYIIDSYNDNEVQIVLKNDGVLYSLKDDIKYPDDFDNKNIVDMYTNFNNSDNIAVIKYKSGEVYAFNYLTGDKIFSSASNENVGFIDYISDKFSNDVDNSIPSLVPVEKYTEVNLLKGKLFEISIDEANAKLENDNSSEPTSTDEYISVYNDITRKYDIYKVDNILNSTELEAETEKINRDYELVQFYETLNVEEKSRSLSGIIIFTLSIMAILSTLYILVKRKRLRG